MDYKAEVSRQPDLVVPDLGGSSFLSFSKPIDGSDWDCTLVISIEPGCIQIFLGI